MKISLPKGVSNVQINEVSYKLANQAIKDITIFTIAGSSALLEVDIVVLEMTFNK
ncbi:MAG: hypothetical protein PHY93_08835 [Bacteriovorax sp.]|nr:hypothetical protein [Bacteriovorax sp.]